MHIEHIVRLDKPETGLNQPDYLSYIYLFSALKTAISTYANGNVLDIGCGNKPYKIFFEGKVNSYTGCDIVQSDKNMVDIICPATEIPVGDGTKDTVFSTQVIEHVADHKKMLSEAFRILKPGGCLILSGPMVWDHHEQPYDFFRFTYFGFEYLLKEVGFTEFTITPAGGKWAVVGQTLQNSIRSSLYEKRSSLRSFVRFFYFLFRLKWLINAVFYRLDRKDSDYRICLNFVVVAKKTHDSSTL